MDLSEYATLKPYFDATEHYTNGARVEITDLDYRSMYWLWQVRDYLKSPVYLIWNPRHVGTDKIDFCCPGKTMWELFLALTRFPLCSWGLYSGGSAHIDTRMYLVYPARWLAIRPSERPYAIEAGVETSASTTRTPAGNPEWLYLPYTPACVQLVLTLAERNAGVRGSV